MTIADPAAAIVGQHLTWKPYRVWGQVKTISGSLTFFAATLVISLLAASWSGLSVFTAGIGLILLIRILWVSPL